jgi:hypothetical protein
MELLGTPTARQREQQEHTDLLMELIDKPTARRASQTDKFRTQESD